MRMISWMRWELFIWSTRPQYTCEETFLGYGVDRRGVDELIVMPMVNAHLLDVLSSSFKLSMTSNSTRAMEHRAKQNPLSLIW